MPALVIIPTPLFFSLSIAFLMLSVIWSCINWVWSRRNQHMLPPAVSSVQAETPLADVETTEMPAISGWERHTSPFDLSDTTTSRIFRRVPSNKYPFNIPGLEPMTPLPDVMREPAHINKVVMRAGDWVDTRDQFGLIMPDYCGPLNAVQLKIMEQYQGVWLVPKEMTGHHKITRFKRVRPTDYQIPPIISPRYLPEVREESPIH